MDGLGVMEVNIRLGGRVLGNETFEDQDLAKPICSSNIQDASLRERHIVEGNVEIVTPLRQAVLRDCEDEIDLELASRESEEVFLFGGESLLDELPVEMIYYILSFLKGNEIALASQVCKFFKEAFEIETELVKQRREAIQDKLQHIEAVLNGTFARVFEGEDGSDRGRLLRLLSLLVFQCGGGFEQALKLARATNDYLWFKKSQNELLVAYTKKQLAKGDNKAEALAALNASLALISIRGKEAMEPSYISVIMAYAERELDKMDAQTDHETAFKNLLENLPVVGFGYLIQQRDIYEPLLVAYAKSQLAKADTNAAALQVFENCLWFLNGVYIAHRPLIEAYTKHRFSKVATVEDALSVLQEFLKLAEEVQDTFQKRHTRCYVKVAYAKTRFAMTSSDLDGLNTLDSVLAIISNIDEEIPWIGFAYEKVFLAYIKNRLDKAESDVEAFDVLRSVRPKREHYALNTDVFERKQAILALTGPYKRILRKAKIAEQVATLEGARWQDEQGKQVVFEGNAEAIRGLIS